MRRALAAAIASIAAIAALLAYHSPTATLEPPDTAPSTTPTSTSTVPATSTTVATSRETTTPAPTTTTVDEVTEVGPAEAATQPSLGWSFGVVQVSVVEVGHDILSVRALELPPDGDTGGAGTKPTTVSISNYAAPILEREAVASQGHDIATVSGATYTVDAFVKSLDAALGRG